MERDSPRSFLEYRGLEASGVRQFVLKNQTHAGAGSTGLPTLQMSLLQSGNTKAILDLEHISTFLGIGYKYCAYDNQESAIVSWPRCGD